MRTPAFQIMAFAFTFFALPTLARTEDVSVKVEARAFEPGEVILIRVQDADETAPIKGKFLSESLEFSPVPSGMLGLAGIDLEAKTGPASLRIEGKGKDGKAFVWIQDIEIKPKEFPVKKLTVDDAYVRPSKKDAARASKEAKRLRAIFETRTPERFFEGTFSAPVPGAKAGRFGERRVFNNVPKAPHSGADLEATLGTPVAATAGGKVVLADNLFYPGNTIVLDHGYGLYSVYAHLSKMSVKPGDVVEKGKIIGEVGATGRVTGPHLHWGIKLYDDRIDPFSLTSLDLDRWLKPAPTPSPTPPT